MSEPLCPHCLQPLRGRYEGNCPHCGRSLENRNPEGALPLGTQLAGRYTIGTYLSADGDGLAYRGTRRRSSSSSKSISPLPFATAAAPRER